MRRMALGLMIMMMIFPALARPGPNWEGIPENIREWFQKLMQPDFPMMSCCGEADAFEADSFEVEGDHYVAIITNERDNLPDSAKIPAGTKISIPNKKVNWNSPPNPTGHGIVFLSSPVGSANEGENAQIAYGKTNGYTYVVVNGFWRVLYCFVPPAGV